MSIRYDYAASAYELRIRNERKNDCNVKQANKRSQTVKFTNPSSINHITVITTIKRTTRQLILPGGGHSPVHRLGGDDAVLLTL